LRRPESWGATPAGGDPRTASAVPEEREVKPKNFVKDAARNGGTVRGIHVTFPAPTVIEVLAPLGLDFVYIDGEHGRFDWRDVELMCLTAERYDLTPIARVPDPSSSTITRYLDRGVRGLVVPHVESVDDAKRAIEACCFAPAGARSFGAGRPEYLERGADRSAYMKACNDALSLCMMIESAAGVSAAGAIARLPGVDYLSFGLNDLAQSLGRPGEPGHPDVKRAVADCTVRIHEAGKRVREDFMQFAWVNDVLRAGFRQLLG
jgi:2-keto-3-deoxy-L-rhamnonate aldolase RhmA